MFLEPFENPSWLSGLRQAGMPEDYFASFCLLAFFFRKNEKRARFIYGCSHGLRVL